MFGLSSPGTIEKTRSPLCDLRTRESRRIGNPELERLTLRWNCGQELPRSGRESLVAVVKSANLRYGNDGSECRRVHGLWFGRVLGERQVRPGFVIKTPERISRAGKGKPR